MTAERDRTIPDQSRSPGDESLSQRDPSTGGDTGTTLSKDLELAANVVMSENQRALTRIDWLTVENLIGSISRSKRVFVCGEGRSGLAVRMAAMRLMHLGRRVHVVTETTTPALGSGDVLIAVSGSGGTPGVVMVAEQARAAGGEIVAVTTATSSRLAMIADLVVPIPAAGKHDHTSESSAQFAGSLFEQATVLLFDTVFHALSRQLGKTPETLWLAHANLE